MALSAEDRKRWYPNDPEPKVPTKNERGMYVIQEVIHHGDYRSVRQIEVYSINTTTVDAVIMSSAYCYGTWQDSDYRKAKLEELVKDLQTGHVNRSVGWSTFRVL